MIDFAAAFRALAPALDRALCEALRNPPPRRRPQRRGRIMLRDGTVATGTCVAVAMAGHPRGAYVTLVLDDARGRPRTIDDGGRQCYVPERTVEWL